jgi:predicted dehydrogenase
MKILLLGGGRMGQRHLKGLLENASAITLIEPKHEMQEMCSKIVSDNSAVNLVVFSSVHDLRKNDFDLAIISGPASGRLEQFKSLIELGIKKFLIEKPLEQSRAKTRGFLKVAQEANVTVWSNHYRRSLDTYKELIDLKEPLNITVTSGAMGLGCNGIHWIDFALHLTGQTSGKMLYGEIDELSIGSGRGTEFRDYGGRGLFSFPDGSRLFLSSTASSSAASVFSIMAKNQHWAVDQDAGKAIIHRQDKSLNHPTYLYGKDYSVEVSEELEQIDLINHTRKFIADLKNGQDTGFPTLEMVLPGYELLFDLLECSGMQEFQFT